VRRRLLSRAIEGPRVCDPFRNQRQSGVVLPRQTDRYVRPGYSLRKERCGPRYLPRSKRSHRALFLLPAVSRVFAPRIEIDLHVSHVTGTLQRVPARDELPATRLVLRLLPARSPWTCRRRCMRGLRARRSACPSSSSSRRRLRHAVREPLGDRGAPVSHARRARGGVSAGSSGSKARH